jgi:hypothetical protein
MQAWKKTQYPCQRLHLYPHDAQPLISMRCIYQNLLQTSTWAASATGLSVLALFAYS